MSFGRHKISGKRYLNILKKADTSTSSLDVRVSRRGRSTSKRPCMNKNARAARENRIQQSLGRVDLAVGNLYKVLA
ncbi:uncharacterized protein LOC105693389 isoform X4 [Athalia rosae]|uniref:uncharacterized protein LOC105693389 isoform X4 n=1 Tax=Athalia rosae TaxID=37344 RepID=UPI0020346F3C|nr:uncharacterized protein LOC105693389 isoform X4 [Athalia rosae]